ADLVLDHGADAAAEGRGAEEQEQDSRYRKRDDGSPDAPDRHRYADDRDRLPADVDVQSAGGIAPGEQPPDDERDSQRQQEPEEDPLLAALAIHGAHQGEVEQDGHPGRR